MDDLREGGVLTWGSPHPNWNPWLNQPVIIEGAEEYQVLQLYYHVLYTNIQTDSTYDCSLKDAKSIVKFFGR